MDLPAQSLSVKITIDGHTIYDVPAKTPPAQYEIAAICRVPISPHHTVTGGFLLFDSEMFGQTLEEWVARVATELDAGEPVRLTVPDEMAEVATVTAADFDRDTGALTVHLSA